MWEVAWICSPVDTVQKMFHKNELGWCSEKKKKQWTGPTSKKNTVNTIFSDSKHQKQVTFFFVHPCSMLRCPTGSGHLRFEALNGWLQGFQPGGDLLNKGLQRPQATSHGTATCLAEDHQVVLARIQSGSTTARKKELQIRIQTWLQPQFIPYLHLLHATFQSRHGLFLWLKIVGYLSNHKMKGFTENISQLFGVDMGW